MAGYGDYIRSATRSGEATGGDTGSDSDYSDAEMQGKAMTDVLSGSVIENNETVLLEKKDQEGGGSLLDPLSVSDNLKKAVNPAEISQLKNLPKSLGDYSGFQDLVSAIVSGANSVKAMINKALTIPSIDMINRKLSGAAARNNLNVNVVNATLGMTKAILCGDSNALMFDLTAMINALNYDFDFLRSFNICGRSKVRNPIDTLLKGYENLQFQANMIQGLPNRILNNARRATKSLILDLNLPSSLETCLLNKSILEMSSTLGSGISLGKLNNLLQSLNPSICSNDSAGIPGNDRLMKKAAVTPLVRGMTTYDKKSMYAYYSTVLNKGTVDKSILLEVLSEGLDVKENKNTLNTLELIAFTKVSKGKTVNKKKAPASIAAINKDMHKYEGSDAMVLDNILKANAEGTTVKPTTITNVRGGYVEDVYASCDVNATQVLSNFADDLTKVKDPIKTFDNTVQLLTIADPTFEAKKHTDTISNCHQLGALAQRSFFSTGNRNLPSKLVTIEDGRKFLEIEEKELSLMDNVGILHYVNHNKTPSCIEFDRQQEQNQ